MKWNYDNDDKWWKENKPHHKKFQFENISISTNHTSIHSSFHWRGLEEVWELSMVSSFLWCRERCVMWESMREMFERDDEIERDERCDDVFVWEKRDGLMFLFISSLISPNQPSYQLINHLINQQHQINIFIKPTILSNQTINQPNQIINNQLINHLTNQTISKSSQINHHPNLWNESKIEFESDHLRWWMQLKIMNYRKQLYHPLLIFLFIFL